MATTTDTQRAAEALALVQQARSMLHKALAVLENPDSIRLLSTPPMIDDAIDYLDDAAGDLEGEIDPDTEDAGWTTRGIGAA